MNEPTSFASQKTLLDRRTLDRLVDGELSQADEQALLVHLDDDAGDWRLVALGFLEARAVRRALKLNSPDRQSIAVRRASAECEPQHVREAGTATRRVRTQRALAVALAATAFVLGMATASYWPQDGRASRSDVTDAPRTETINPGAAEPDSLAEHAGARTSHAPLGTDDSRSPPDPTAADHPADHTLRFKLPLVEESQLPAGWASRLEPALPADVSRALERTGHRVDQSRQWYPVRLNDGRRAVLPVDHVRVHYVGHGEFQ